MKVHVDMDLDESRRAAVEEAVNGCPMLAIRIEG
jgi:ferredoxin